MARTKKTQAKPSSTPAWGSTSSVGRPRTMASRLVEGLYFAGEVLDVDADTGGYNLQAAFSTGRLAGESAAERWHEMSN